MLSFIRVYRPVEYDVHGDSDLKDLVWFKNLGHNFSFFDQKFDNGVNWFGINQMVSFQDITQNRFCNMAKISHPADHEIC